MDIDRVIERMEATMAEMGEELAALKRARDRVNGSDATENLRHAKPPITADDSDWHAKLPELLSERSLTVKEIQEKLKEQYPDISYTTIFAWIKRAVNRGEFTKRSRKYRFNPNSAAE